MTFREQAAIAIWSGAWANEAYIDAEDGAVTVKTAATEAQELADACCELWGHDEHHHVPLEIGAATLAAPYRSPVHRACVRCGKKLS